LLNFAPADGQANTIPSSRNVERQLMEQIDYNPLFRWFVGLGIYEHHFRSLVARPPSLQNGFT